ncbi:hypothetical protein [Methylorubrum extorquens]|uniref:hypothetical protein n=1 Tax=Methylorubrum extorquens TaxID=408 RepID=UPI001EE56650|nr:hypothetical protein [Methylorubrum extorquens]MCG5247966.1 hypothetical protein [Methylorubrum extorquens]
MSEQDASLVKGMVARGDRKHDIAAWFGVNQGRIAEVEKGELHPDAEEADEEELPPPGPYSSGQSSFAASEALRSSRKALRQAIKDIDAALEQLDNGSKLQD